MRDYFKKRCTQRRRDFRSRWLTRGYGFLKFILNRHHGCLLIVASLNYNFKKGGWNTNRKHHRASVLNYLDECRICANCFLHTFDGCGVDEFGSDFHLVWAPRHQCEFVPRLSLHFDLHIIANIIRVNASKQGMNIFVSYCRQFAFNFDVVEPVPTFFARRFWDFQFFQVVVISCRASSFFFQTLRIIKDHRY